MPTYEYKCRKCGHEWELQQKISSEPAKMCPKCDSMEAKRLISKPSFVLKGPGWADDGYS